LKTSPKARGSNLPVWWNSSNAKTTTGVLGSEKNWSGDAATVSWRRGVLEQKEGKSGLSFENSLQNSQKNARALGHSPGIWSKGKTLPQRPTPTRGETQTRPIGSFQGNIKGRWEGECHGGYVQMNLSSVKDKKKNHRHRG